MRKAIVATIAVVLASSGAAAQSLDQVRWSGPYVGGSIGYAFGLGSLGLGASPDQCLIDGELIPLLDDSLIIGTTAGSAIYSADVAAILEPSNPSIGGPGGSIANYLDFNPAATLSSTGGCMEISNVFEMGTGGYVFFYGADDGTVVEGNSMPNAPVDMRGIQGSVYAGYGVVHNDIYFGAEAEVGLGAIGGSVESGGVTLESRLDVLGSLRARIGKPMGVFMPYLTGGVAFGQGVLERSGAETSTDRQWHLGGTIGAGIEWALAENIAARGEYSFTHLGSHDSSQSFSINRFAIGLTVRH